MVAAIDGYQPAPPQTQTGARSKRPRQRVPYAQLQAQIFVTRHEPRVRPDAVNYKPDVDTPRCNTRHWHAETTQAREKRLWCTRSCIQRGKQLRTQRIAFHDVPAVELFGEQMQFGREGTSDARLHPNAALGLLHCRANRVKVAEMMKAKRE